MEDYQIATYVDLNGAWWVAAGLTFAAGGVELGLVAVPVTVARILGVGALAVDVAGLAEDAGIDILPRIKFGGPVDNTYPTVYYDSLHIGKAAWQLHLSAPKGMKP